MVKSLVFGVLATWIALFRGFCALLPSDGVSRATTRSVVHSALAVLDLDFVLTVTTAGVRIGWVEAILLDKQTL